MPARIGERSAVLGRCEHAHARRPALHAPALRSSAVEPTFPDDLTSRLNETTVATAIHGEERLFEARRSARAGQRARLREPDRPKQRRRNRARAKISETELQMRREQTCNEIFMTRSRRKLVIFAPTTAPSLP